MYIAQQITIARFLFKGLEGNKLNFNTVIMKNIILIIVLSLVAATAVYADDKPVDYNKLPKAARDFITANYPGEKVSYALVDDDISRPDYSVMLANGVLVHFEHNGALEKIESEAGIAEDLIPFQIRDYVKMHYPDAIFVEYEIGKKSYEVKLSNRLEIKFNKNFNVIEVDD